MTSRNNRRLKSTVIDRRLQPAVLVFAIQKKSVIFKMYKYLITGLSGFVGGHFLEYLAQVEP
ncbi:MAG: hypothetical protein LBU65_12000, partial [Planctomycetaceae bacterium]|nr:hypothetical protein [Planctomycetaceae bacterium]